MNHALTSTTERRLPDSSSSSTFERNENSSSGGRNRKFSSKTRRSASTRRHRQDVHELFFDWVNSEMTVFTFLRARHFRNLLARIHARSTYDTIMESGFTLWCAKLVLVYTYEYVRALLITCKHKTTQVYAFVAIIRKTMFSGVYIICFSRCTHTRLFLLPQVTLGLTLPPPKMFLRRQNFS